MLQQPGQDIDPCAVVLAASVVLEPDTRQDSITDLHSVVLRGRGGPPAVTQHSLLAGQRQQ